MHAQKIGPGQRSWFLLLTKRSAASGDENTAVLDFSGENTTNDYAKYWGVKEVYYEICASRELKKKKLFVYIFFVCV